MKIIIPDEFVKSINKMPYNKTVKKNAVKIYAALYNKSYLANKNGYFPVPSEYLQSINKRYYKIMEYFIEEGLIKYYEREFQDPNDIFKSTYKKYYNTEKGICMKYKFLVNIEEGLEINVDMITNNHNRWYSIIENSLLECNFEQINIKRDNFGRRVFHSGIHNYKKNFKGYYLIDAISSQPKILYNMLKESNINDENYYDIFENGKDFYSEIAYKLRLESRQDAKELFMYWINGNGYVPNFNIHTLFPGASKFIKNTKKGNYKNLGSMLQRKESKIWIDNILNNIPCEWALPIHDCILVKEEDSQKVFDYVKSNYPDVEIKLEKIK